VGGHVKCLSQPFMDFLNILLTCHCTGNLFLMATVFGNRGFFNLAFCWP